MQLAGAVALITGASSGIGAATAIALAKARARLILTGRDEAALARVAGRTGGVAMPADLEQPGAPEALAAAALATYGRVDLLVCNAGSGWAGPTARMPAADVARLVTLNLLAPIQLARAMLPGMTARGHGQLVFVSSIAGVTGARQEAVYGATKAALNNLADSMRYELAGSGVGVSVVVPGVVDTPFFSRRGRPYERVWPRPVDANRVAAAIADAATRGLPVVYVPGWLGFPAWLHGAAPGLFRRLATRFG